MSEAELEADNLHDEKQQKENRIKQLERELAEKNETANIFMAQVKKLQAENAELCAKTSLEGYRAMGAQVATALDERDEARNNYALAHENLGKEVVENGKLETQLREARAVIDDMVNSLDGADYDRARKFLGMDEFSESGRKLAAEISQ